MFRCSSAAASRRSASAFSTASESRSARQFLEGVAALALDLRIGREDAAVRVRGERRVLGLRERVLADHLDLAPLDPGDPLAVRLDQAGLHVGHCLDRATLLLDHRHFGPGAVHQLGDEPVHDLRALEDVRVLQEVGLEGEDLLDAEAPLLVPRPGQAEGLVPGGQLDRPGAGVAAERHRKGLEHDPGDVVLRLRLGQAERIDLHAVAQPQVLLVRDAVALAPDLLPELGHRAQLRVLLDEPDTGVDEERDPAEDLREVLLGHLAARAHLVEHCDRGRERVRDLLDGRGPGLLEVVAADVGRVPARDLVDGERDGVRDQAHRRAGREGVGAAREVLLDDVVLGGPLERRQLDSVLLGDRAVEAQEPGRGCVDRHRRVHLAQRDAVEQGVHVALVRDRDADLADLATRQHGVGVVPGLGGQVEGDRQARLALREVAAVELVRPAGVRMARVGAHDPGAVRVGQAVLGHTDILGFSCDGERN